MMPRFAIDVGGTFTDCLAMVTPDQRQRLKVLSSSVVKGVARCAPNQPDGSHWIDRARCDEPLGFWRQARFSCFANDGTLLDQTLVIESQSSDGMLQLDRPLSLPSAVLNLEAPLRYELTRSEPAPLLAIRLALGLRGDQSIPTVDVRLGTTRGTNALLTRTGAPTAWVTTRGFADLLAIGDQQRPRLFDLAIRKPQPLYQATAEIIERVDARGNLLIALDEAHALSELKRLKSLGIESLAIGLLHAYVQPEHELQLERLAQQVGFSSIRLSHRTAPVIKLLARGRTTLVDAYLDGVLQDYLRAIEQGLGPGSRLSLMTSAGDLVSPARFSGKDSLLSGPAGGVVALAQVSRISGQGRGIGFDMGGTSTDVSRFDGRFEWESESHKAEVSVVVPTLAIETVAAGGGSICQVLDGRLRVGPGSAGADPGPACYGRGGPLSVTDLNVWLGRVREERFPFPLDRTAIEQRLQRELEHLNRASGSVGDTTSLVPGESDSVSTSEALDSLALGFWRIANAKMASAIRSVSVGKGYDPRRYALVAFGGAAAQHACAVADELGMTRVLSPADASILSASGIGAASRSARAQQAVYAPLRDRALSDYEDAFQALAQQAEQQLRDELPALLTTGLCFERAVELRYVGTDTPLRIDWSAATQHASSHALAINNPDVSRAFTDLHQQRFGYRQERPIEIVALHVTVREAAAHEPEADRWQVKRVVSSSITQQLLGARGWQSAQVHERTTLLPGDAVIGPSLIVDDHSTIVVDHGWIAAQLDSQTIELRRTDSASAASGSVGDTAALDNTSEAELNELASSEIDGDRPLDPVEVELFANHFQSIAEQMGLTLRNTAASVNVKERLDYSCALFDSAGHLVVNAPHIPVHLGAMSETVRCLVRDEPLIEPGDVFVTNDPYLGGSHLPDLTVITPVFATESHKTRSEATPSKTTPSKTTPSRAELKRPDFFVASRAHHAEIGGMTPGSMPPSSRTLGDEGVVLRHFRVLQRGESRLDALERGLSGNVDAEDRERLYVRYPSRTPSENVADVRAQIAANRQGEQRLMELCVEHHGDRVKRAMSALQGIARERLEAVLVALGPGERTFVDAMDDGSRIAVKLTVKTNRLTVDFSGTADVHPGNLNANRGIVMAAVMYVLRCLMSSESKLSALRLAERGSGEGSAMDERLAGDSFEVPLNHGLLEAVDLILPVGMLNPPEPTDVLSGAAVVGGNVETSQRLVDVLLGAIGIAAASQGTMNNLLFGDASFGYYETICGGSGATLWSDGADAVHTHMTNTRITDPEVLEHRFPVRLWQFAIRSGSGGAGRFRGGSGVVRELEFLRRLTVSLITNRRTGAAPYGIAGGEAGKRGENVLRVLDSRTEPEAAERTDRAEPQIEDGATSEMRFQETQLPGTTQIEVQAGDRLVIKTPGAGGAGR